MLVTKFGQQKKNAKPLDSFDCNLSKISFPEKINKLMKNKSLELTNLNRIVGEVDELLPGWDEREFLVVQQVNFDTPAHLLQVVYAQVLQHLHHILQHSVLKMVYFLLINRPNLLHKYQIQGVPINIGIQDEFDIVFVMN